MNDAILTPNQVVGKAVKAWMARFNITQKQLASMLNISQAAVSEKLRGKITFTITELVTISGNLNLTLAELLGESIINAKIPSTASSNEGDKEIAPVGFKPTGATYEVVAGARFELATSGLSVPIFAQVTASTIIIQKILSSIAEHLKGEVK